LRERFRNEITGWVFVNEELLKERKELSSAIWFDVLKEGYD